MKVSLSGLKGYATLSLAALMVGTASGQVPGAGTPAGMNAAMTRLFGDIKGFSAQTELRVMDGSQAEIVSMPMKFALLDQKIRIETDAAEVKNKSMPAGMTEALKRWGLARVVSLIRPDKGLVYVLYPDQKALLRFPLPDDGVSGAPKITKTPLGKETVAGHPCTKNKVVISGGQSQAVEATTWEASDLKGFPVQIETKDGGNTSVMRFRDIQLAKPDPAQFYPPAGYTVYRNQDELGQAIQKKAEGGKEAK